MKILFLIGVFASLIVSATAQRAFHEYTCQLNHKNFESIFYLKLEEIKEVTIGDWTVKSGLMKNQNTIEAMLRRNIKLEDANWTKESRKAFPLNATNLHVELRHDFEGKTDQFKMVCYPRDP